VSSIVSELWVSRGNKGGSAGAAFRLLTDSADGATAIGRPATAGLLAAVFVHLLRTAAFF